jgi:hypothetical protein
LAKIDNSSAFLIFGYSNACKRYWQRLRLSDNGSTGLDDQLRAAHALQIHAPVLGVDDVGYSFPAATQSNGDGCPD